MKVLLNYMLPWLFFELAHCSEQWRKMKYIFILSFLTIDIVGGAITPKEATYSAAVGDDVAITWIYDFEPDMFAVEWSFKNTTAQSPSVVMSQLSGNSAQLDDPNFNIEHAGNGNVTLKQVTKENVGIYYCKVLYTGASARPAVTGTATFSIAGCSCECNCTDCKRPCQAVDGVSLSNSVTTVTVILMVWFIILKGDKAATVGPFAAQTLLIGVEVASSAISLILGIVGAAAFYEEDCQKCDCDCDCICEDCETCLILSIVSICVAVIGAIVCILVIRFCGKDSAGGGDQGRGRPNGGPTNTGIKTKPKESHEMIPTAQHKIEDTSSAGAVSRQDVHLERRPMPAIPSHNRGLSANMEDPKRLPDVDRDLPRDGRSKKLEPLDLDRDNPEKKKKKKKKKKDSEWSENENTGLDF